MTGKSIMKINQKTVYQVSDFSHENGIGNMRYIFENKEAIIDFFTYCAHSHSILSDEFGKITDNKMLLDYIDDKMVLKIAEPELEKGSLFELLGREKEPDMYYIVHAIDLIQSVKWEVEDDIE